LVIQAVSQFFRLFEGTASNNHLRAGFPQQLLADAASRAAVAADYKNDGCRHLRIPVPHDRAPLRMSDISV
jgi:hypothetical protein